MTDDQQPEKTAETPAPATTPPAEPFVLRVNPRELAPVLAQLALQCPTRREDLQRLDESRDRAAVYLRDHGRPADLQFRPLSDFHPDLCLIAAHALDADAGAVICVVFKTQGEEINFAFEAPAREMPAEEVAPETGAQAQEPAPMVTLTREEFAQAIRGAIAESVAPLAQEIEALKKEREEKKPATREEVYAQRAAEYDAALHENMMAEVKSRKKVDPDELLDKMMARQEAFTRRLFESFRTTQNLAAEFTPPAPEKKALGETIVEKVLTKVDEFTQGAGKEPFQKKGAA